MTAAGAFQVMCRHSAGILPIQGHTNPVRDSRSLSVMGRSRRLLITRSWSACCHSTSTIQHSRRSTQIVLNHRTWQWNWSTRRTRGCCGGCRNFKFSHVLSCLLQKVSPLCTEETIHPSMVSDCCFQYIRSGVKLMRTIIMTMMMYMIIMVVIMMSIMIRMIGEAARMIMIM